MSETYQLFRFWSPVSGCDVVRVSMCDDRGGEFFAHIPDNEGPKALRRKIHGSEEPHVPGALDAIMDAMDRGDQPGQVHF